jgi:hypothetical protein
MFAEPSRVETRTTLAVDALSGRSERPLVDGAPDAVRLAGDAA